MATSDKKPATPMETWGRTWLVVTGASKGLGAEICKQFCALLADESLVVGLARNLEGLLQTKEAVQQINPRIKFVGSSVDLESAKEESLHKLLSEALDDVDKGFDRCVLVHNAGSLGDLNYLKQATQSQNIKTYFDLNLSSVLVLNSQFLEVCRNLPSKPMINIINISSLCATLPIKSMGLYCTGKAARLMLFKILAKEEDGMDVLSYCPGPLEGEMTNFISENASDPEVREMFKNMIEGDKLVEMSSSVTKLISLLRSGNYSSGDNIDYYDI